MYKGHANNLYERSFDTSFNDAALWLRQKFALHDNCFSKMLPTITSLNSAGITES